MHKQRVWRHEVTQPQDQSIRLIPLTQGQNAIVDAIDYDWLMQWNWFAQWNPGTKSFYARRKLKKGSTKSHIEMHRIIMACDESLDIDHRDHRTLNNQRINLRITTPTYNCANSRKRNNASSKYKGVSWNKSKAKWQAQINCRRVAKYLGTFLGEEDAARIYDVHATEMFGEFAILNFPKESTAI